MCPDGAGDTLQEQSAVLVLGGALEVKEAVRLELVSNVSDPWVIVIVTVIVENSKATMTPHGRM